MTTFQIVGGRGTCNGCGASIHFTFEDGKATERDADGTSHLETCPYAAEFRRSKAAPGLEIQGALL